MKTWSVKVWLDDSLIFETLQWAFFFLDSKTKIVKRIEFNMRFDQRYVHNKRYT